MSKRGWIPLKLKHVIASLPCVVCGVPFDIRVDHIIPVACGGGNEPENLQPLCRGCNYTKKGKRIDNDELTRMIFNKGRDHFRDAVFVYETRFCNPYDRLSYSTWIHENKEPREYADSLYERFIESIGEK